MEHLEAFIEAVRSQLQPPARGNAAANTVQQLASLISEDVVLADLAAGWRHLAIPHGEGGESIGVAERRKTCAELAEIASQFTEEPGELRSAYEAWLAWQRAFQYSGNDPRHAAMARTFTRELGELAHHL